MPVDRKALNDMIEGWRNVEYPLPALAERLIRAAAEAGWMVSVCGYEDVEGSYLMSVETGRSFPAYHVKVVWAADDDKAPGSLRLLSSGWKREADQVHRGWGWKSRIGVSRIIREITDNPVSEDDKELMRRELTR